MQKIALVGASGAIGRSIADALNKEGREYRVVGRDSGSMTAAFGNSKLAEISTWNPDDPASARAALRGSETIVYLVGVPYHRFALHPVLMRKTLDAAIAEGVERLLLIGTVYPYGKPQTTPVTEDHPREPQTFKGRMRKEQEDVLLEADAAGKIHGAILRLPDFYGPNVKNSFLDSLFQAAADGGTANMIGPIDTPHEFVFVPDVGPVTTALASNSGAWGRWWNLAGPGAVTQRDLAERVFKMAGTKPRIRVAGKSTLRLLGLFNPLMRELVEMHYLQTTPVLMDDRALHGLLGTIHKTPYDDGLRQSLDAARGPMHRAA
jgi:nucleoside-diphosphate-sugar epimerase